MGLGAGGQPAEFGRHLTQRPADDGRVADGQKLDRAVIDGRDTALAVKADHACRHPGEHGLDEPAAARGFLAGGPQRGLLRFEIARHAVESGRQRLDLAGAVLAVYTRGQVTACNLVCRLHQTANGRGDGAGRRHPQPDRTDKYQQGGLEISKGKGGLDTGSALAGFTEGNDGFPAIAHLGHQSRLHRPDKIQIGLAVTRQRIQGADGIRVLGHLNGSRLSPGGRFEVPERRREIGRRARQFASRQHLSLSVDNVEGGIAKQVSDLGQDFRKLDRIVEAGPRLRRGQLLSDGLQIRFDLQADVPDIGLADQRTVLDRRGDILAEPLVHAAIDQQAEHQGDQHRRYQRHHREQGHKAQMQPRPRISPAAEQHQGPATDHGGQTPDQQQIDAEDDQNRLACSRPGSRPVGIRRHGHQPDCGGCDQECYGVGDQEGVAAAILGPVGQPANRAASISGRSGINIGGRCIRHATPASPNCGEISTPWLLECVTYSHSVARAVSTAAAVSSRHRRAFAARRSSASAGQGACSTYQPRCLRNIFSPSGRS